MLNKATYTIWTKYLKQFKHSNLYSLSKYPIQSFLYITNIVSSRIYSVHTVTYIV